MYNKPCRFPFQMLDLQVSYHTHTTSQITRHYIPVFSNGAINKWKVESIESVKKAISRICSLSAKLQSVIGDECDSSKLSWDRFVLALEE